MNAYLIYIQEKELRKDSIQKISFISDNVGPLYIFVQLNKLDFWPLINNFRDIRTNKLRNKIREWLKSSNLDNTELKIEFLDQQLRPKQLKKSLSKIKNLTLLSSKDEMEKIEQLTKQSLELNTFDVKYIEFD